jgi:hypothetical protein
LGREAAELESLPRNKSPHFQVLVREKSPVTKKTEKDEKK